MELVSLGQEMLQNLAEHAASYRLGQSMLRQLDRALWVVEKCARWAVPPPLDQDERPPPELVRPLPWVFFLAMLIALRVTRESISLVNLVIGKPPLRSADVVMFIQSKRRYLRTLKYQGNRMMRARSSQTHRPWYTSLYSLFELTMCFRRQSHQYDNNNTTRVSNNDEVVVVKRPKRGREDTSPAASVSENSMERLIEKMMVDLDAESDEDSSYTLTNLTSPKSSDGTLKSDQDTVYHNDESKTPSPKHNGTNNSIDDIHFSPNKDISSTPEKNETNSENKNSVNENVENRSSESGNFKNKTSESVNFENKTSESGNFENKTSESGNFENKTSESGNFENRSSENGNTDVHNANIDTNLTTNSTNIDTSDKQATENFIKNEAKITTPKKEHKIANGRTVKSVPNKKKGGHRERQHSNEVLPPKVLASNNSF